MSKYLVETISYFHHKFIVEAESAEKAKASVLNTEVDEVAQYHINESVISTREINDAECVRIWDENDPYYGLD